MKAYRIPYQMEDYYVAALSPLQAIATLTEHVEDDVGDTALALCQEVDPAKIPVSYEKDDGDFEPGTLAEMMPTDGNPVVLIDPEYP